MQINDFLTRWHTKDMHPFKSTHRGICFTTVSYPSGIVFCAKLIAQLKEEQFSVVSLDLTAFSFAQVISQLEMSFLGLSHLIWLRGFEEIDKKYKQSLGQYLETYQGPHRVSMLCSPDDAIKNFLTMALDVAIHPVEFEALFTFCTKKNAKGSQEFFKKVCQTYPKISIDQACMLSAYMQVIGRSSQTWALCQEILEADHSLFQLSQYFFAKDAHTFFTVWYSCQKKYQPLFWCSFWSEQIWRAYYVHYFLRKNEKGSAKNIGFRLPYSYMQGDWKKSSLAELKAAHDYMYTLELGFKNSTEVTVGFDLFFNKFFLGQFNLSA